LCLQVTSCACSRTQPLVLLPNRGFLNDGWLMWRGAGLSSRHRQVFDKRSSAFGPQYIPIDIEPTRCTSQMRSMRHHLRLIDLRRIQWGARLVGSVEEASILCCVVMTRGASVSLPSRTIVSQLADQLRLQQNSAACVVAHTHTQRVF